MVSHLLRIRDRSVIEFGYLMEYTVQDWYEITRMVYGEQGPSLSLIYKCYSELEMGTFQLTCRSPPGRCIREVDILSVEKIVHENPSMSIRGIAETANLSRYSVRIILFNILDYVKRSTKYIPRLLTEDQKGIEFKLQKNNLQY